MTTDSIAPADKSFPQCAAYPLPLPNGRPAAYWLLPFDAAVFDPHAFARHDIPCPPSIARSALKRQAEFFHGRMAARRALEPFGQGRVEVGCGPMRSPLWPRGIIGSISHNRNYAAAVALPAFRRDGIGIDIESVIEPELYDTLATTVVNSVEMAHLNSLRDEVPIERLLTLVFSAKESFYKAAFPTVGRFFDFSAAELSALDLKRGSIGFVLREDLGGALDAGTHHQACFFMIDPVTVCTSCYLATDGP